MIYRDGNIAPLWPKLDIWKKNNIVDSRFQLAQWLKNISLHICISLLFCAHIHERIVEFWWLLKWLFVVYISCPQPFQLCVLTVAAVGGGGNGFTCVPLAQMQLCGLTHSPAACMAWFPMGHGLAPGLGTPGLHQSMYHILVKVSFI